VKKLSIFLITVALIAGMAGCVETTPHPSQNLQIRDWYDLDAVRDKLAGNHTLLNDLDSTTPGYEELASPTANQGKGWEPIGYPDPHDPYQIDLFIGSFDGQGHKIRDLFINRPDESLVGLFGVVGGGNIENIGVVNVTVTGEHEVGGLVGHIDDGAVSNSYATGNVTGKGYYVGGLVGCINGASVSNVYSTGSVTGDEWVGGLVGGGAWSTVSNSYSTGSVSGNDDVGGLVGLNFSDLTVSNSFWDIETSGQTTSDGGTGKTTAEMKDIATFSEAEWDICAVAPGGHNTAHIWNIVDGETYPFLSWEP
jgi:hypothetical protein